MSQPKHVMQSAPGPETTIDGRPFLYFCGTGYLGLQGHAELIRAACEATQAYGLGTATSRVGYGNAPPIVEVERLAAEFWGCEDAFYFASGYLGNHVVLSALAASAHVIFLDEHAHYSEVDACRFFDLPVHRFAHRDAQALRESLRGHVRPGEVPLVMSDGVFASLGSIAPIRDYMSVLQPYPGAMLCLDDCHAFGVLGERGRGTCEYHGIDSQTINEVPDGSDTPSPRLYVAGTLSKAFGGYGGIVCGTTRFIDRVRSSSHYYRAASAPPIPVAAASAAALRLVATSPQRIGQVQENARHLKRELKKLGLGVDDSPVPIVNLTLGSAQRMKRVQQALAEEGILIAYSENYAGLSACGALRIAVFATHTTEMIQRLSMSIGRYL